MQGGPHRKIILLLSFSLLSILLVQAFWLRNFYVERTVQFHSKVYSALEQIVSKLHEREQLKIIKQRGDSLLATRREVVKVLSRRKSAPKANKVRITNTKPSTTALVMVNDAIMFSGSPAELAYATSIKKWHTDSMFYSYEMQLADKERQLHSREQQLKNMRFQKEVQVAQLGSQLKQMSFSIESLDKGLEAAQKAAAMADAMLRKAREDSLKEVELESLMGRMITEIQINETDETHPDSLCSVIKGVLASKGLVTPFEFSLKKIVPGKQEIITQSEGFDSTRAYVKADLSSQRLLKSNNYLFLQFPEQSNLVLAGMRGSLILSLVFLGIILGVFYYTLKLILRQKKISDIRNDFVNNMTHELKTPIATISLAVDAMQHTQVRESEQRYNEYTRILKEENRKLNSHVERVLQLALFDKGQINMNERVFDFAAIAESQVKAYGLRAESNGLQLFFNKTGKNFNMMGDEEHIGSAISNLIDNAIKYTDRNGIVNVSLVSDESGIGISVNDTGRGISKDDREKIFDKFYRVNNKDLHDVKGFGIGLSYVRSIVEAHGGRISLESEPGKGSTFKITFKRYE